MRNTELLFTQYHSSVTSILARYIKQFHQTNTRDKGAGAAREFLRTHEELYRKEASSIATYIIIDSGADNDLHCRVTSEGQEIIKALSKEIMNEAAGSQTPPKLLH